MQACATTAAELGVSTVTVEHAYSLLCEEGYVESRERSGYYVIFRESDGFEASVTVNEPRALQSFCFQCLPKQCAVLFLITGRRYLNGLRDAVVTN